MLDIFTQKRHHFLYKKVMPLAVLFLISLHFPAYISYRKIYLQTNNTARIYISGVIFFAFPQIRLIIT